MFPSSTPSFTTPTSGETLAAGGHTSLHVAEEANIVALANKVGTGASTPTSSTVLTGNGSGTSAWGQVSLSTSVSGLLPTTNGGTGTTSTTGSGSNVFNTSPALTMPTVTGGTFSSPTTTNINNTAGLTNTGGLTTDTLGVTGATTLSTVTNKVLALNGNPVWQYLGSTNVTAGASNATGTNALITGATVTVTIPSGTTAVRVTGHCPQVANSSAGHYFYLNIYKGTIGSGGTQIQQAPTISSGAGSASPIFTQVILTGVSAGSQTYQLGFNTDGAGTATASATATQPIFILVECC